jgi:hypothetical protein
MPKERGGKGALYVHLAGAMMQTCKHAYPDRKAG